MTDRALRLFVALSLGKSAREELARWRDAVVGASDALRAVGDADLHVTLCFLGSHPPASVAGIVAALAAARTSRGPALALGEPLWLPRRAPRLLAVSLQDSGGGLAAVQSVLSEALAAGGWYRPEARPFLPHVTLARVRRGARVRAVGLQAPVPVAFTGRRVTLFASVLGRSGARYEPLGAVCLGG